MSNLKLPELSYSALLAADYSVDKLTTVAYATQIARTEGDMFAILHHGTTIAIIKPDMVYLSNDGWDTMTTLTRLNKVASDNGLPVRVSKRQGKASLLNRATLKVERTFEQLGYGIKFYRSPIAPAGWAREADNKTLAFAS